MHTLRQALCDQTACSWFEQHELMSATGGAARTPAWVESIRGPDVRESDLSRARSAGADAISAAAARPSASALTLMSAHGKSLMQQVGPGSKVWVYNPALPPPRGPGAAPLADDPDPAGRHSTILGATSDAQLVYLPAVVTHKSGAETVSVQPLGHDGNPQRGASSITVHADDLFLRNTDDDVGPDNLLDLKHIHEPSVVHALGERFSRRQTSTWAADVLVHINPLADIEDADGNSFRSPYHMLLTRWDATLRFLQNASGLEVRPEESLAVIITVVGSKQLTRRPCRRRFARHLTSSKWRMKPSHDSYATD